MLDNLFETQLGYVAGEGKTSAAAMVKRHGLMAVKRAGFGVCAAKRALRKYIASDLLSKYNGIYHKTSKLK